jgi:uncharacterized membrane protein
MSQHKEPAQTKDTARIEAFSDGVFAIAVTLLVLDLKVPDLDMDQVTDAELRGRLLRQWPAYLGFLSSFGTILIIWVNHHNLFNLIRRTDRAFLFINGFLLLLVTFIPFPTALLSRFILSDAAPTAAFVYAFTYFLLAIAFNLLWYAARDRKLMVQNADTRVHFRGIFRGYLLGPFIYGLATVLALFMPLFSVILCLVMAVFFAVLYYGQEGQTKS